MVRQVNHTAEVEGRRPVVFTTLVNVEVLQVIEEGCKAMVLDMFGTFVRPLEIELGMKSSHRVGRFADVSKSQEYHDRIEAINFSLAHDDGQAARPDRPTSSWSASAAAARRRLIYLAMQHGLKANYPLIPGRLSAAAAARAGPPQEDRSSILPERPARSATPPQLSYVRWRTAARGG